MTVIGIVGLPGSGKSEAAAVARELGVPVVTMGDVIRAACRDRGLPVTEENMGTVATDLRADDGDAAVAARVFEDAFGDRFELISVEAPFETRLDRIRDRGRDATAEGADDLRARDEREKGYGMGEAMANADAVIENTGTLAAFREAVRARIEAARTEAP
jgi:dephospho-CoA kinase